MVASCVGRVYCLERATGVALWDHDIREGEERRNFHGDGLIVGETLFIGSDGEVGGGVYALGLEHGSLRWRTPIACTGGGVCGASSDMARAGERLYVTTLEDTLLCLDAATGETRWKYGSALQPDTERRFPKAPAVADTAVYFGGLDGSLRRLDPDGDVVWTTTLDGSIRTSVVGDEAAVYAGTSEGTLYKVDAESGDVVAKLDLGGPLAQPIVLAGGRLVLFVSWPFAGSEVAVVDTSLATVHWRRRATGDRKWTTARLYVDGGRVIVGNNQSELFEYDLSDGSLSTATRLPEGTVRSVGITKDELFVGTIQGVVYAIAR